MGNSRRVDSIPSFTFRKLTSESLKMIDTKDPTFLNTCLRYGQSNLTDGFSYKKDNSKHLVEDENFISDHWFRFNTFHESEFRSADFKILNWLGN